ncbi:MAG: hypothetical protein DPW18_08840 [Chloroflexi bacterium]|nr:hypothetical protein [Chloroflexota bacterium]MDL1943786.1 hypothetical protein [Chloroflexi bacterium CFX2]
MTNSVFSSIKKFCLFILAVSLFASPQPSARAQTNRILFAVIGDYGLAGQAEADVASLVKSWNPDFIVTVGDNNYPDGLAETIDQNIGQYYQEFIHPYKGKYGSGSPARRFFPSLGNHDWGGSGVKPYLEYFGFRSNQTYYDFVQGPVHFFMLDSDRNEPDGVTFKSEQAIWLKKGLAASTSPYNVVVFHHAPYSSGRHGSTEYMRWPFKEWGADVVLTGHDHVYERLLVNGLPYFVNGLGGSEIYNFNAILPESQARFNQDFGAMRVEATSAYMKFQMITRAGILVDEYLIGQGNPEVLSINPVGASPANADALTFQVTFSEAVTGVDAGDFAIVTNLSGAGIGNVSGLGNTYTVSVNSGSGDGTLRLDVQDDDSITNAAGSSLGGAGIGNGNFTRGAAVVVDRSAPTVTSIIPAGANPSNASIVDFTVSFSEPVTGVDLTDFSLSTSAGAQLTAVNGAGSAYTVSIVTGAGNDLLRLDFAVNGSVTDLAGNSISRGFTGETHVIDHTAPIAASISRMGEPSASGVEYAVSFSEAVTGVDGSDFVLSTMNGASIANISGAGNLYSVFIHLNPGSDALRLDLIDNDSIYDAAGNPLGGAGLGNGNYYGEPVPIAIETPIVTSIIRASPSPTKADSVDFIVTFSEIVEGVDVTDFMISGKPDAGILGVRSVNPFYIVTANTGASDGVLKLDLVDDDSIRNMQGIPLGGNGTGNANFTAGETCIVDRTPPRATSIIRAGSNPAINPSVDFIVTFSEPVTGVDVSDFRIATSNLNAAVVNIQDANPFYVVTVNTGAGSGTLRLDLMDNRSVGDLAGNLLADNGSGNGGFTTGEAFTIAKIPVNFPAPTIAEINHKHLINYSAPTIAWSAVRNAQAYEVFLARDANFAQLVALQTTSATFFIPDLPLADGTYFARVWAYNASLSPGKFSRTYTFTIDTTPPAPPTPASPPNHSSTPKRPSLKWSAVNGAVQYQVELDDNPDFSSPEFSAVTNRTDAQTKTLPTGRTYYWRVRAVDAARNWSGWSVVFVIQVY